MAFRAERVSPSQLRSKCSMSIRDSVTGSLVTSSFQRLGGGGGGYLEMSLNWNRLLLPVFTCK